ncbi:acyltransferase family protein [Nocardiopsis algeriensis]|uniref:acyltransferase family protein n=1 Tax=Nocardiopsis algeriensis TaxID=1478215 RepID=UPI0031B5A13E
MPISVSAPHVPGRSSNSPAAAQPSAKNTYRPEIEGLRGVAVLLVAVYHIWFGTVSGGVDVFLVLTGFFITGSLVRTVERQGKINPLSFLTRLAKRLFPSAAVVMAGILVAALLFFPRSRWPDIIADTFASALYVQNWNLALNSVDYLAQNNAASPLQHFWSLAIQGQFYLLWLVLAMAAAALARRFGLRLHSAVLGYCTTVLVLSFSYSLYMTHHNPEWAYFDTWTRLWELALGGLLAILLPRMRDLPRRLRILMGWLGLAALSLCGLLVPVDIHFPGFIALWPVLAALMVILAGNTGSRVGADRLLTWAPLTRLGGMGYSLYLWHWPILVTYLEMTDRVRPSLTGGAYILALSLLLSWLTTRFVEGGVTRVTQRFPKRRVSLSLAAAFLVPVLAASLGWQQHMERQTELISVHSQDTTLYPGAEIIANPALAEDLPQLPLFPQPEDARESTVVETDDCNVGIQGSEPIVCEFGPDDADHTIALVGSSHARHWFQALEQISEKHGWRLVTILKSGCQFSTDEQVHRGEPFTDCTEWNNATYERIAAEQPDTVFTLASLSDAGGDGAEELPEGYRERWRQMEELGIRVVALRDTPRLAFDAIECVDRNQRNECATEVSHSLADVPPYEGLEAEHPNVRFLDMTEALCPSGSCPAVFGNVLAYHDDNHLTAAFSRSLAPVLEPLLLEAVE